MAFAVPEPSRPNLLVGYAGNGIRPQAPLLVAEEAGYFGDAGFSDVTVARVPDVIDGVRQGAIDIGAVPARDAYELIAEDPSAQIIAGYRNYQQGTGEYRGDVLIAAPGLVTDEPATVMAFLNAYLRALDLLSTDAGAQEGYELLQASGVGVDIGPDAWPRSLQAYAPFDGGFGALDEADGLGELSAHLAPDEDQELDLDGVIATHTLAVAQTWMGAAANPANPLAGPPDTPMVTVAMSDPDSGPDAISTAADAGRFDDVAFESVAVVDVEQPLLGVLQGEVEFGVMDLSDATEAAAQGLPLVVLAGHRNYAEDGSYGDDVLVTSRDFLDQSGATVGAFAVGYLAGLQQLADASDAQPFAPFDGGFGDRARGGGLEELAEYLEASGLSGSLDTLDTAPLHYGQAWWGLPANPVPVTTNQEGE
jgi:ABC-type nitrate/sulfonate/bicarbonate transport system substrate-binding protein